MSFVKITHHSGRMRAVNDSRIEEIEINDAGQLELTMARGIKHTITDEPEKILKELGLKLKELKQLAPPEPEPDSAATFEPEAEVIDDPDIIPPQVRKRK